MKNRADILSSILRSPRFGLLALFAFGLSSATFVWSSTNRGFSIQQQGESAWLVQPNGERFFSLGVCVVSH